MDVRSHIHFDVPLGSRDLQSTDRQSTGVGFLMMTRLNSIWLLCLLTALTGGCGTTLSRSATEQLLTSDAVDRSVATIDFRSMAGKKVYFDTKYIRNIKGIGFVNSDYIISSLRQQMVAARCLLQDQQEDADYIVEARVGALGSDSHEISYGIPATGTLVTAATSFVPTMPTMPTIPELSVAKKNNQKAAAKIRVFAYNRETREPVWQSGLAEARSTAKDTWIFGAGPFQQGTIYDGTRFAGNKFRLPFLGSRRKPKRSAGVPYDSEFHFESRSSKIAEDDPAEDTVRTPAVSATATGANDESLPGRVRIGQSRNYRPADPIAERADQRPRSTELLRTSTPRVRGSGGPYSFPEEMKLFSPDSQLLNDPNSRSPARGFSNQLWQDSTDSFQPPE